MNSANNIITLNYPIDCNGVEVKELRLRRPKVRDLELIDGIEGDMKKSITLISNLSEVSPDEIRALDASDFQKAAELVEDFLG